MANKPAGSTVSGEGIQSTAKWVVAAAGALGAATAAGLQFSGLGDARSPIVAVASFAAAFLAAAAVVRSGARVLLPAYDSLADLERHELRLVNDAARWTKPWPVANPTPLQKFAAMGDPMFLHLVPVFARSPSELLRAAQSKDAGDAAAATRLANEMVATCNAFHARARFRRLIRTLEFACVVLLVAVPALAFAISPHDVRSPAISEPVDVSVLFAEPPAGVAGDRCETDQEFVGLAVGGTFERPIIRVPAQHRCSGASVQLAPGDRYVVAGD